MAEEQWLRELCQQCQGEVHAIASALGVHRTTVIRKLNYGIAYARKGSFRSTQVETSSLPGSLSVSLDSAGR